MMTIDLTRTTPRTVRTRRSWLPFLPAVLLLAALARPTTPVRECSEFWVIDHGQWMITNEASLQVGRLMGRWTDSTLVEPAC